MEEIWKGASLERRDCTVLKDRALWTRQSVHVSRPESLCQQPEGSQSCVGNHGVCVGRHSCFPALWTLRGITARSTLIVGLLREKEWRIISLMHHPTPVLAVSFRWCELRKTRGWERVTERAGAICYLLSHSIVSRENIIGVCVIRLIGICVISTKLIFRKPMDRYLGANIWQGESILKKNLGHCVCSWEWWDLFQLLFFSLLKKQPNSFPVILRLLPTQQKLMSDLPFWNEAR